MLDLSFKRKSNQLNAKLFILQIIYILKKLSVLLHDEIVRFFSSTKAKIAILTDFIENILLSY
ncbi:cell shape-determining protein MreC [Sphingobacterium zeae]|uniref:Cell shape-determining protein MreC n=1 Tax=Sphingobacterium zeae TaxID=1776859 RepID=A0ABU0U0A9_9SPHI|nr:cell shape-determining protein MreC [Sphingobacterium zeae]